MLVLLIFSKKQVAPEREIKISSVSNARHIDGVKTEIRA